MPEAAILAIASQSPEISWPSELDRRRRPIKRDKWGCYRKRVRLPEPPHGNRDPGPKSEIGQGDNQDRGARRNPAGELKTLP
jgi:hypothetical protein